MPRFFRLLALALVSVTAIWGQEALYTLRVDVPFVNIDVSVQDQAGRPVTNLTRNDFEVTEDGIPQDIRYFTAVSSPYNVLLLLDRSGSTQHKWVFMQRAVAAYIASMRPQDRVAVGTFDYDLEMQVDWTAERSKAVLALPNLLRPKAIGATNFYEALDHALRHGFKQIDGRRAVLVLTDGRDTMLYRHLVAESRLRDFDEDRGFQKLFNTARQKQIPIYFVALNTDKNLDTNVIGGDEYRNLQVLFPHSGMAEQYLSQVSERMRRLADVSGGRVLYPERIEDIAGLYEQIGRELGLSYSLGYVANNPTTKAYRRVEVRSRNTQMSVSQSRSGYYAK